MLKTLNCISCSANYRNSSHYAITLLALYQIGDLYRTSDVEFLNLGLGSVFGPTGLSFLTSLLWCGDAEARLAV